MHIRLFRAEDATQIAQLFHDTVHTINLRDYNIDQIQAWSPETLDWRDWETVCTNRYTYVAEHQSLILGFAELEKNGHIGCFYCHKNYQGKGFGRKLYRAIEHQAKVLALTCLDVEASITARPFFEKMGFLLIQEQQVDRGGQTFINYWMQKRLPEQDRK